MRKRKRERKRERERKRKRALPQSGSALWRNLDGLVEVPYMERNLDKLAEVPLWRNLDELPDHLPTVRTVATATDMNPKGGGGAGSTLLDQLVEGKMTLHPAEPLVAGGRIGHTDVGRFTLQMLRVGGTTYRPIEGRTTVAAGDDDRLAEMAPERFEHLRTEMPQVPDHLLGWFVRNAPTDGCFGTNQLFQTEMGG